MRTHNFAGMTDKMITPQPRYKIYTKPSTYYVTLHDLIMNKMHKGDELDSLKDKLRVMLGVQYVIPMPTARFSIYLTIKNLIKPGQDVILSPYTISDVVNMVICAGGKPVFADIQSETCNIDPISVEKLIDKNTGCVLVTHLHGLACDVDGIKDICSKYRIPLVEDAAQAFSTKLNGRYCGTLSDVGIYSFGMYKIVNSFFGGFLVTNRKDIYDSIQNEIRYLPYFNKKVYSKKVISALLTDVATSSLIFPFFTHKLFRYAFNNNVDFINNMVIVDRFPERKKNIPEHYKCRMSPLQARLILDQLDNVEVFNKIRMKNAKLYHEGLHDIPGIQLPPLREDMSHIYTYYPIQHVDRRSLMRYGLKHGRDWVLSHYHNCASIAAFSEFSRPCPVADKVSGSLIYLPTYPRYREYEIYKNIDIIRKYFNH